MRVRWESSTFWRHGGGGAQDGEWVGYRYKWTGLVASGQVYCGFRLRSCFPSACVSYIKQKGSFWLVEIP